MELNVEWHSRRLAALQFGPLFDRGTDPAALEDAVRRAALIAVDPGEPSGVACFSYYRADGISLHEASSHQLADVLVHSVPTGIPVDMVCETPLHGTQRVFDPHPWRVRGFLELWFKSVHSDDLFIPAQVSWLKVGHALCEHSRASSRHASDALAYGVAALVLNPVLRERLTKELM